MKWLSLSSCSYGGKIIFQILLVCLAINLKLLALAAEKLELPALPDDFSITHQLHLKIAPQYMEKLEAKAAQAAKVGILISRPDDWVPGRLYVNRQKMVPVKVRLKGDWMDHLKGKCRSFRFKVKKPQTVLGMSKFSVQIIQTRKGYLEAIVLRNLRESGVLAPRYFFVHFLLNGKDKGIMALEQHFTKEFLEAQGRRDSVILAFDEDYDWNQRFVNRTLNKQKDGQVEVIPLKSYMEMPEIPLRVFQEQRILKKPVLKEFYREALGLMRGYINGDIPTDQVFDSELLAAFFINTHLWNVDHHFMWINYRAYYNPVTRLFEPISFDNEAEDKETSYVKLNFCKFYNAELTQEFIAEYKQKVQAMQPLVASGEFVKKLRRWEAQIRAHLQNREPLGPPYPWQVLPRRFQTIAEHKFTRNYIGINAFRRDWKKKQKPLQKKGYIDTFLQVFYIEDKDQAYLEFFNPMGRDIVINNIYLQSRKIKKRLSVPLFRSKIPPNLDPDKRVRVKVPKISSLKDAYHIIATYNKYNANREITAQRYFPAFKHAKYQPPDLKTFSQQFPFMQINNKEAVIPAGRWEIKQTLIVPKGFTLIIQPGARLYFGAGCRCVVRGPVIAKGTPDAAIELTSLETWAGLVVLKARALSQLKHLHVSRTGSPPDDDWELTGAVTFYKSPVEIFDSSFQYNKTEDFLNIIHSHVTLKSTSFSQTSSDAVDIDYGRGIAENCRFENISGDGLDISRTSLTASGCYFKTIGDKAISVGEASAFKGERLTIQDANIAIASKDGSKARLLNSKVSNIHVAAFMAYIKKSVYAGAYLEIKHTAVENSRKIVMAGPKNKVVIDGREQKTQSIDLQQIYPAR